MKFYYANDNDVYCFKKNVIYPKKTKSTLHQTGLLFVEDRDYSYVIRPKFLLQKLKKLPIYRSKRGINPPETKNLLYWYNYYITDTLCCDTNVKFGFAIKKQFEYIERTLKDLRISPELFVNYCFRESQDILIPHPGRLKSYLGRILKSDRKEPFLLVDEIKDQLENMNLIECGLFEIHPCIICLHPYIVGKLRENKQCRMDDFWKSMVVAYIIVCKYSKLRRVILESEMYRDFISYDISESIKNGRKSFCSQRKSDENLTKI